MDENQKEAARKKTLGELGELVAIKTLVDHGYKNVQNLNDKHMNAPYADIYCEKDDKRFVISVKSRNKYQFDGALNTHYNLGENAYENAKNASEKNGGAEAYWMAIQFDMHDYSVYLGSLESLNGKTSIPVTKCADGELGQVLERNKKHYFDFDYFKNN